MKDIYELLRRKELEISRVEIEVQALRLTVPLLSDDRKVGNELNSPSSRWTAPSALIRAPRVLNASPKPQPMGPGITNIALFIDAAGTCSPSKVTIAGGPATSVARAR